MFPPFFSGCRRHFILEPTHRPPFCHANHGKPLAASGSLAFRLAACGSSAYGLAASESVGFQCVFLWLTVLGLVVAGSMVFLCGFRFPVAVSMAAGSMAAEFQALCSATSNSDALWFKQRRVHRTDAAEPTSFTATPEHNADEPDVGEAAGLYSALSGRHNNQPILIIN